MKKRYRSYLLLAALGVPSLLGACSGAEEREPIAPATQGMKAAPLGAGTLVTSSDGRFTIAVDPDRNGIFVTDAELASSRTIRTQAGEAPGRVIANDTTALVALRGSAEVLVVELETAEVERRIEVCADPRGLAFSADGSEVFVACASGKLVTLSLATSEITRTLTLDADLRDVEVFGDGLAVSRFRDAEVLLLDADGQVTSRVRPVDALGQSLATVAYRMRVLGGSIYLLHQFSQTSDVPEGDSGYGDVFGGSIVVPALTVLAPPVPDGIPPQGYEGLSLWARTSIHLSCAGSVVDFALLSEDHAVLVAPGNAWAKPPLPAVIELQGFLDLGLSFDGQACTQLSEEEALVPPVAVAAGLGGMAVFQSREPAQVWRADRASSPLLLSDESRADQGHRLFHMTTAAGVSCASCHPDGGDDGHSWGFAGFGVRRTQNLQGGVSNIAPFHWDGSLETMSDLMGEVFVSRMGQGEMPSPADIDELVSWLDTIPSGAAGPRDEADSDATLVQEGQALFEDPEVACSSCHRGPRLTDNLPHDVGTGDAFFTPPLNGIGARPPYLHDGCAKTLKDRFGICGGGDAHGKTSHLSDGQIDALVAFMNTL